MEIVYIYNPTPTWCAEHWMYASISGTDFADCCENAKKYYEKQVKSLGWSKISTFKEAKLLTHVNDPHPRKDNPDLTRAGESRNSGTSRKSNRKTTKKTAGRNSGTETSATSTGKPKRNRKDTEGFSGTPKASGGRSRAGKKRS